MNNKSLSNYSGFIDILYICSNHARIACLNKLIDKNGFSIYSLIEYIRTYPQLFDAKKEVTISKLNEIEAEIKKHDSVISYLIEHRNEFHAHLGRKSVASEDIYNVFFEFKVSEEEIDGLIRALCQSVMKLNFIFHELYGNAFIYNLINNEDFIYDLCEIRKVFSLMSDESNNTKSINYKSDLYFENLTKHYH